MQPKYRNDGDGFRLGSQYGRNRSRNGGGSGSFNRSYSKPYNLPCSKMDILMEAGRLAAEYLVAKGVFPASVLPENNLSDSSLPEFRGRESAYQASYPEVRTSALARLGDSGSDASYGRRFNHDYDRTGSRKNGRGRRKMAYNDRGYGLDWGRDRGRNGSWNERSRRYSDSMEEEEEDFSPGFRNRERRGGYDEVGSSVSRVAGDEQQSKSVVGESGSELDDTGSKASYNSARKEVLPEMDEELTKGLDDVQVSTIECGEVKSAKSGELEKTSDDEDMDVKPEEIENVSGSNHSNNLLSLYGFSKVPTRPRSSLAHKGVPVGQSPELEASSKVEVPTMRDSEILMEVSADDPLIEVSAADPKEDLHTMHVDNSKGEVPVLITECTEERVQSEDEAHKSPLCLESSTMTVDETKKDDFVQDVGQKMEPEMQIKLPPLSVSQENESFELDTQRIKQSSFQLMLPQDQEMVDAISEIKPVVSTSVQKDEAESFIRSGEEKQNLPASFDLNLMDAPEISEIPDGSVQESCQTSAPLPEGLKQLSVDFGLSVCREEGNTQISGDDKIIINLEDETPVETNIGDSSKPRSEVIYPTLVNAFNHSAHPDDLPLIQDNSYSLGISDFLSCSPSGQTDFNNLQEDMGLHAAEGFAGVDDSIYGSLGDIGFMEVWDNQPSHDYEKFF